MNLQLYFDGCKIKEHGSLIRFGTADRRWQPHTLSIINPFQEPWNHSAVLIHRD